MIVTAIITFICVGLQFFVSVNYDMKDYLPEDSPSTEAIDVMEDEFSSSVPNANVMMKDMTVQEALQFKKELEDIDGVSDVTWLDDAIDTKMPLEMVDDELVETYYKDGNALFSFNIRDGEEVEITDKVYDLIGEDNALTGDALDNATQQKAAFSETMFAAGLLVPIIIIILVLSTTSWLEPVFFLTAIGVSVLINLGTNIFLGEISYVTQSVAPILQLAVSLDYAIFLLHSFQDYRDEGHPPQEAMHLAIGRSFPAIIASASTTFFGFIALTFMNFEIGSDLGLNLVKGIVLSFLSVMIFLPALTLMFYKGIDKTQHKPFIPKFKHVGKFVMKIRIPVVLIVVLLLVPAFLAQNQITFIYGIGEQEETTRPGLDESEIEDVFGKNTDIVLLVPRGDVATEERLVSDVNDLKHVTNTLSYVTAVSAVIPEEYIDEDVKEEFYSEHYSRIIITTDLGDEGEEAFEVIEEVKEIADNYYGADYYTLGESVTLYDMKNVVEKDNTVVNLLTVVTIAFVLLVTFKSLMFPVLLLLTIQASVWINLSVPYFTDEPLVFIGYLIVSTVQLAATVDYAILLTVEYRDNRKIMPAFPAVKKTLDDKLFSIVISASILSSVGFILWITSSDPIVSSIGLLLGRGALLAFMMVVLLLPAMLVLLDKIIEKSTWKARFFQEEKEEN